MAFYDEALQALVGTAIGQRLKPLFLKVDALSVGVPDEIDESSPVYFYFGWESFNGGGWLIQRQLRETSAAQSAATGAVDFAAAWAARETLGYS